MIPEVDGSSEGGLVRGTTLKSITDELKRLARMTGVAPVTVSSDAGGVRIGIETSEFARIENAQLTQAPSGIYLYGKLWTKFDEGGTYGNEITINTRRYGGSVDVSNCWPVLSNGSVILVGLIGNKWWCLFPFGKRSICS